MIQQLNKLAPDAEPIPEDYALPYHEDTFLEEVRAWVMDHTFSAMTASDAFVLLEKRDYLYRGIFKPSASYVFMTAGLSLGTFFLTSDAGLTGVEALHLVRADETPVSPYALVDFDGSGMDAEGAFTAYSHKGVTTQMVQLQRIVHAT